MLVPLQSIEGGRKFAVCQCVVQHLAVPLRLAFQGGEGQVKAVLVLLEGKADVNAKETDCYTPLHLAAWRGLPEGRANANVKTKDCRTPLHSAASAKVKARLLASFLS